jgi:hypothetical protein
MEFSDSWIGTRFSFLPTDYHRAAGSWLIRPTIEEVTPSLDAGREALAQQLLGKPVVFKKMNPWAAFTRTIRAKQQRGEI